MRAEVPLTTETLLQAYQIGIFPMAHTRDSQTVFWVDPKRRGVLPLDRVHISRSLARLIRNGTYRVTLNADFERVLNACADRNETWISKPLADLYCALHAQNYAHSLEIWEADTLWGGIYGIALGQAFYGESMVSCRRDGSKLALVYLAAHLRRCQFDLFDTQFVTDHLQSMGAEEIDRSTYHARLAKALNGCADIRAHPLPTRHEILAQRNTQTS